MLAFICTVHWKEKEVTLAQSHYFTDEEAEAREKLGCDHTVSWWMIWVKTRGSEHPACL